MSDFTCHRDRFRRTYFHKVTRATNHRRAFPSFRLPNFPQMASVDPDYDVKGVLSTSPRCRFTQILIRYIWPQCGSEPQTTFLHSVGDHSNEITRLIHSASASRGLALRGLTDLINLLLPLSIRKICLVPCGYAQKKNKITFPLH